MGRVKGEVWHKGMIVPVEVEVNKNWLGLPGVVVHIPKEYKDAADLIYMINFTADLDDEVREIRQNNKDKYIK